MSEQLKLGNSDLDLAISGLHADLIHEGGPQISTMRNYRFAIVPYPPDREFALRARVSQLSAALISNGWVVLSLSLQSLMMERLRRELSDEDIERLIAFERRLAGRDADRGLNYLKDKLVHMLEGPEGIAADCAAKIRAFAEAHPDKAERTVAFIGRAGALYPFLRTSALLKHLDGRTGNVPVVLLYPGSRKGEAGLSFMDVLQPDRDYRPRIYP